MKWFGRKAGREGARVPLGSGGSAMAAGDWPRSYDAQLREAMGGNPVVQRAVRIVSDEVARVPMTASDPALIALVSQRISGVPLLETVAAHLMLHGNAYVQIVTDGAGAVAMLFPLRPERVSIECDADGWPVAYRYRVGARTTRVAAEDAAGRLQLLHLRTINPGDDHYGLGCLGAAAGAVAIHNAATRWNRALLDNAARPSGALVYDPGDGSAMTREQFERLRGEMEAGFAGAANAGRPMLLEGGLRWQAMSITPAEMDFVALKANAAREIALAFGVPPLLLGMPGDNTHANYREANRALWRSTVLPLARMVLEAIAQAVTPWFAEARLDVDLNQVLVLAEERERLWRQVSAADFLTPAEKRAMLGIEG